MSYQRLPDSKRNELIAEFNEGKINPDYEVIPSKTQKGKYTVRKRKVKLPTDENVQDPAPDQPNEEPEPEPEEENQGVFQNDASYVPQFKMKKAAMFREFQMEMNRMFIEQMKMMRQQLKQQDKKRTKLKNKSQAVYNVLAEIARAPPEEPQEPEPEPEPEQPQEEQPSQNVADYFSPAYQSPEPPKEVQPPKAPPEPEPKEYQQPYEAEIDKMDGTYYKPYSRRDRLNFKNFNI